MKSYQKTIIDSRKATTKKGKFKQKRNLKAKVTSIEEELNNPNIVAFLGREPIYIHNTRKNAELGLKYVAGQINKILDKKIANIQLMLKDWIIKLQKSENDLYQKLDLGISNQNGLEFLQQWWKEVIKENPNKSFSDFINAIFSLKQLTFDLQKLTKEEKKEGTKIIPIQKEADQAGTIIRQYLEEDMKKLNSKRKTLIVKYKKELSKALNMTDPLTVNLDELRDIQTTLGKMYEFAAEQGAKFLQKQFGVFLSHYSPEMVGNRKQGSTDLKLTLGSYSVGLSAKLRKLNVRENGEYITKLRYGAKATGTTVENYFNNNANSAFKLSSQEIEQIKYAIANWKSFSPINYSTIFQESLMSLLAWNKIIFNFLGEEYNNIELMPTFLISFDEIIPMRWLLSKVLEMSKNSTQSILSIINKDTGSWQTKRAISKDTMEELYSVKTKILKRMSRNNETISYNSLKRNIIPNLEKLNIQLGTFSVKYKILVNNFNELSKYN